MNGGNILQKFGDLDLDDDKMIHKPDFRKLLSKMGIDRVEEDVIDGVYYLFDPSNSG